MEDEGVEAINDSFERVAHNHTVGGCIVPDSAALFSVSDLSIITVEWPLNFGRIEIVCDISNPQVPGHRCHMFDLRLVIQVKYTWSSSCFRSIYWFDE